MHRNFFSSSICTWI